MEKKNQEERRGGCWRKFCLSNVFFIPVMATCVCPLFSVLFSPCLCISSVFTTNPPLCLQIPPSVSPHFPPVFTPFFSFFSSSRYFYSSPRFFLNFHPPVCVFSSANYRLYAAWQGMGEVSRVWCLGMVCYGESGGRNGAAWLLVWQSMLPTISFF